RGRPKDLARNTAARSGRPHNATSSTPTTIGPDRRSGGSGTPVGAVGRWSTGGGAGWRTAGRCSSVIAASPSARCRNRWHQRGTRTGRMGDRSVELRVLRALPLDLEEVWEG